MVMYLPLLYRRSQFNSRCLLAGALGCAAMATLPWAPRPAKLLLWGGAGVLTGFRGRSLQLEQEYRPFHEEFSLAQHQQFRGYIRLQSDATQSVIDAAWTSVPGVEAAITAGELPPVVETFNWQLLNDDPDRYPHVAITGPTGSGKSTLAEALAGMLGGVTIAIAPHRKPGDFAALGDRVYAGGRRFGTEKDAPVTIDELIDGTAGKCSVTSVIRCLGEEMDRRYDLMDKGEDIGPFLNVIWDEIVACMGVCPGLVPRVFLQLLRESRKVGIRLIVLPQDDQVESLKLRGQGAARSNLCYIRLADFAVNYARKMDSEVPGVFDFIQAQSRPCMVGKIPARIPEISPLLAPAQLPAKPEGETSDLELDSDAIQALEGSFLLPSFERSSEDGDQAFADAISRFNWGKEFISARDVRNGSSQFKNLKADQINRILQGLADRGVGRVSKVKRSLVWYPPGNVGDTV